MSAFCIIMQFVLGCCDEKVCIFYVFLQLLTAVNRLYKISRNPAVLVVVLRQKEGIIRLL